MAATVLPVVSLLWASSVSKSEVEHRSLAGLAATGKATVLQAQQAWDDAVRIVTVGASRPPRAEALESSSPEETSRVANNFLLVGPFADVRVFDTAGGLVATAARPGVTPTPVNVTDAGSMSFGGLITVDARTTRQVGAPIRSGVSGPVLGRLVVDVDVTQLLGKPSDLGFGRTGTKLFVTRAGTVVAGPRAVGTNLRSSENRLISATGKPVTTVVYSRFYKRLTAESYEPIPGQDIGIFVQQDRAEVMGGADHLAGLMRWVALAVGLLGMALAVALGVVAGRRSRRAAASERRLADGEAESRRRFEQLVEAIPIGIFVAGSDGQPYYANHEAERLLGRGIVPGVRAEDLSEVYSVYVAGTNDLYPPAELPVARALRGEACHVEDIEIHRADATLPVEVWGTPVLSGDNSVVFGVAAFLDVAERRRAMEEVQFLSAITANMSEGVLLMRAEDSTIVYANSSLGAMFGYEPAELIGRDVADLCVPGPNSSEHGTEAILEGLWKDGTWRGEVESVRKDGSRFWRAVNATATEHPEFGSVWISVSSDITARRQALEDQARFASIVQASTEAILAKTLDGVVTSWNPGAESLFGYPAAEMIGRSVDELIPPEESSVEADLRERVARGLVIEDYETVRRRRDGTLVEVAITLSPIEDADGRVSGIATICRDISERKRSRAVLLEREEQLAAARDQAIEGSRLKSDFLANMSHEIRTPMNAVIGMTGLLLDSPLGDEQREFAGAVRTAGEALLEIINDILDFSKIEAGKLRLEVQDFELCTVVEDVADLLAAEAHEKGLELAAHVDPEVPKLVRGDPGRLRQILTNLVGNAVKFTDHGEVVVRVRAMATTDEAVTLRFEVSDTGIGISPEGQRGLFHPFEQLDSSATRRHGGTGLGLAISRQLVDMMGGEIGLESTPGAGSTFWFSVPLAEASPSAPIAPRWDLKDLRVLVVDDNATNRTILDVQLKRWGALSTLAESGDEALALLRAAAAREEAFDLAVLDFNMPGMDGLTLASAIADDPSSHRTRIVMLTSSGYRGDMDLVRDSVLAAYLPKPVHEARLHECLARVMGRIEETPPADVAGHDARRPPKVGRGARLLVAEDNPVNQLVAVRMLEKLGHRADVVANGMEAIDSLMRIDYAAVLMDCQMPEMDGFEATREIRRRQPSSRYTPVIAMTAAAGQGDREHCLEVGMDDYISKPVKIEELSAVLDRWVVDEGSPDPESSLASAPALTDHVPLGSPRPAGPA